MAAKRPERNPRSAICGSRTILLWFLGHMLEATFGFGVAEIASLSASGCCGRVATTMTRARRWPFHANQFCRNGLTPRDATCESARLDWHSLCQGRAWPISNPAPRRVLSPSSMRPSTRLSGELNTLRPSTSVSSPSIRCSSVGAPAPPASRLFPWCRPIPPIRWPGCHCMDRVMIDLLSTIVLTFSGARAPGVLS